MKFEVKFEIYNDLVEDEDKELELFEVNEPEMNEFVHFDFEWDRMNILLVHLKLRQFLRL